MEISDSSSENQNTYPFDKLDPTRAMYVPGRILEISLLTGKEIHEIPLITKELEITKKKNRTREQLAEIREKMEEEIEKEEPGEETYNNKGAYEIYYDQNTGKIIKKEKLGVSLG